MSMPSNGAQRNTRWTYTYRNRFLVSGAVIYWWIHWRSIDWNKGSHHVKHCIVALIRDTRMHKPTTLGTIVAWQCAQAPYVKKKVEIFKSTACSGCINYQNCSTFIYFLIYPAEKYKMDTGNNKYFVYCTSNSSINQDS